jgi:thioesterase domain-containing protein/acyl carrier protein
MSKTIEIIDAESDTERKVGVVFAEAFSTTSISADADFFELGGDSLLAVGLLLRIEEVLGRSLPLDVLSDRPTVRALAAYIDVPEPATNDAGVIVVQAGRTPPLFCLPGIGGNVIDFQQLKKRVRPTQTICALPAQGVNDGETSHFTIESMAGDVVRRMRATQPNGPYYFLGYSMGGVVAFEAARQLRAAGEEVALLAMLDTTLWSPPIELSFVNKIRLHWDIISKSEPLIRRRYIDDRLRVLKARIKRFSLKREEQDFVEGLALTAASRKIAELHARARRDYQPGIYDRPIVLFRAARDRRLAITEHETDPTLGWSPWTTESVIVHDVNATHVTILRSDALSLLDTYLPRESVEDRAHA